MLVDTRHRGLAPAGLAVGLCLGLLLGSGGLVLAEEIQPSRELLEFLGAFATEDGEVLDMMVEEETGQTMVAGPVDPAPLAGTDETEGLNEGGDYE